jgi:RNA polymerase sigma factor (sigma-70 family)
MLITSLLNHLRSGGITRVVEAISTHDGLRGGLRMNHIDAGTDAVTALVEAARQDDPEAWHRLVDRYAPLIAAVVRGFRLQSSDAEDIVQTVWMRLYEHLHELREPRALPRWVVTTTRNECLRLLRTTQRVHPVDPTGGPEALDCAVATAVEDHILEVERHEVLLAAIAQLPDQQRTLLLLLVADPPVPYREISRRTGIPSGGIGPTRARALRRLRESAEVLGLMHTRPHAGSNGGDRR